MCSLQVYFIYASAKSRIKMVPQGDFGDALDVWKITTTFQFYAKNIQLCHIICTSYFTTYLCPLQRSDLLYSSATAPSIYYIYKFPALTEGRMSYV